jgi:redox-sensitive bicupin YhaK (pirin superfamily)
MNNRTVNRIVSATRVNMGGNYLDQPLPDREVESIDPFLLIHHWYRNFKGGQKQQVVGVGPHPHRGFSPVTFIFKGGVHHRDSQGNNSKVYSGGTQWMNSGSGIVHSERPVKEIAEKGGEFEIIQFWVNSPASHKMISPEYHYSENIADHCFSGDDNKVTAEVISGTINGITGFFNSTSPTLIMKLNFQTGGKIDIDLPVSYNSLIYQLDGKLIHNNNETTGNKTMTHFNNDGDRIGIYAKENTRAILLSGEPIGEPVASYGPMVMNTNLEIIQALNDYENGKMGKLEEIF